MALNIASLATRGGLWLTETNGSSVEAGPSTSRIEPRFGNIVDSLDGPVLHPTSHPIPVFPPSRPTRKSGRRPAQGSQTHIRPKIPDLEDDVPQDIVEELAKEGEALPPSVSGGKIIVAPYDREVSKLLIIGVGGPEDCHIFVSTLESPAWKAHRSYNRRRGRASRATYRGHEDATLKQNLLPSFISDSPILCIKLAPQEPDLHHSHFFEGPWLSVQTLTGIHFCSIHRLTWRIREKPQDTHPEFVLSHICSFLTHAVAKAARDDIPGVLFAMASYSITDVAWAPTAKTSALLVDTVGNVWEWEADLTAGGTRKWLTRGQTCRLAVACHSHDPPIASQSCRIEWADQYAHDRALLISDEAIYGLDLAQGTSEKLYSTSISPILLQPEVFRSAINVFLPTSTEGELLGDMKPPLLIIATSTTIGIFDSINPRRQLAAIPHGRDGSDASLALARVPSHNVLRDQISFVLYSQTTSAMSLYTIGYELKTSEGGVPQASRAWQAESPCEFKSPCADNSDTSCQPLLALWKSILPASSHWNKWRRKAKGRAKVACFFRASTGEIWLQNFTPRAAIQTSLMKKPAIEVLQNSAAVELQRIIKAQDGITRHRLAHRASSTPASLVNLHPVWHTLTNEFASIHSSEAARQHQVLQTIQRGIGHLDDPSIGMITGLDLISLSSLAIGSDKIFTPFVTQEALVSATFPPHALQVPPAYSDALLPLLANGLRHCRSQAWWSGNRFSGAVAEFNSDDRDVDDSDEMSTWERQAKVIYENYVGEEMCQRRQELIQRDALYASCLQIVLHQALSKEVWSTRPIEIQEPTSLDETQAQEHLVSSQPGPGNTQFSSSAIPQKRRRRDSVVESSDTHSTALYNRRRQDSVESTTPTGQPITAQALDPLVNPSQADEQRYQDEDPVRLAKQRFPEPEDVHFAYFKPKREGSNSSAAHPPVTSAAARLLLSSWPMTSLDPTSRESDPSYYTYTDPYTLLDDAKASAEGYASSAVSGASDGESGWSSAWSGGTSALSGGETSASEGDRSRSRSVWSASVGPSSRTGQGTRVADTPQPTRWGRRLAPPSIVPSHPSATTFSQRTERRGPSRPVGDQQHAHHSQASASQQFDSATPGISVSQSHSAVAEVATQPLAGPHASRKSVLAKKQKRRVGGF